MGAGLLVLVDDPHGQVECEAMPGTSLARPAGSEQQFAAPVQRLRLAGLVTDLAERRERSLIAVGGLPIAPPPQPYRA
jgi:hypothetical protein